MRRNLFIGFVLIIILTVLSGLIVWPTGPNLKIGRYFKEIKMHEGLDLQGGSHLVYELDLSKIDKNDVDNSVSGVINVIDRRINALGVSEPVIQSAKIGDKSSVIVELPGISSIDEAISLIGKTAQLEFWEQEINISPELNTTNVPLAWKPTQLNGSHLKRADVQFDQQSGEPQVSLEFNNEGKDLFSEITKKNLQKPVAIVLDNEIISAPTVQSVIEDGNAIISGKFTIQEAKKLAIELNAGALPVPVKLVEQRNVGATLGIESVKQSLLAGLIGIILIAIFMILNYKFPGFLAVIALGIYILLVLSLFKLIPVVLTLAGIAGFILSIGMAVDANVLVFERMKEELREGKTIGAAVNEGFKRAWLSIRDSNVSSLITCLILYYTTTGIVRGFAVTLAIGILVSMFTAITITRTLLRLAVTTRLERIREIT
ncbi:protein-export membrane protein SecD [Candidatus Berkelbacteria bacterium RIFCSPHIGHO2_12_FULL_36_9]|uniref:Protein translocase subunit SecD n=1 Tax=Candidatus Berkelbacteria bacterium RIFCSPHIGHO2_12_FULL_36_9 TaxID=1797469 RepID=A0A1F5EK50_9BACT|nr:MAG: protein-export membrane protein SecD [Candidatus Berkelbacteria bacterium RIFCSPHIGHO2_12_FULL_36_9]